MDTEGLLIPEAANTPESMITRRSFVRNTGLGLSAAALVPGLLSFDNLHQKRPYTGRKLNVALCGLGRYGTVIANALQETSYCRLAGLVCGIL